MGLITFVSPGTQLTQAEYESNFTTIYDEFNGNVDNDNVKPAAGIVDTKLATISTVGKIADSALPTTQAGKIFTSIVVVTGTGGIHLNPGDDVDVNLITVNVLTGTPVLSYDFSEVAFSLNKGLLLTGPPVGIDVVPPSTTEDAFLITVRVDGDPEFSYDFSETAFSLNKGLLLTGTVGLDIFPPGDENADLVTIRVTETPTFSWNNDNNRFALTHVLELTHTDGLDFVPPLDEDVDLLTVVLSIDNPILSYDFSETGFSINKGLLLTGTPVGIDIIPPTSTEDATLYTVRVTATPTPELTYDFSEVAFSFNQGLLLTGIVGLDIIPPSPQDADLLTVRVAANETFSWVNATTEFSLSKGLILSAGNLTLTSGNIVMSGSATVDGIDVSAHDVATTGVHGAGGDTIATDADITTHAALDTGVHGSGGDTLATDADITTHAAITTGVHGLISVPRIQVTHSVDQTIDSGNKQLVWNTENVSSPDEFSGNAWTPSASGAYFLACELTIDPASDGTFSLHIREDSVIIASRVFVIRTAEAFDTISISTVIENSGSEVYDVVATSSTNDAVIKPLLESSFHGFRIGA